MFESISPLESVIINVLASYYPLSQKDLLQKVENQTGKKYSTAGVQKALVMLLGEGILHKNSKYYQLRTDRLLEEKKRIQGILDRYTKAEGYHLFLRKETRYFVESLSQLDYLWNAVIEKWFNFYPKKKYSYWQRQPVPWFPLIHSDEERRIANAICHHCTEYKTFSADCVLTRQVRPIYTELPNSSLHLLKRINPIEHSYSVYHDHVIETWHPRNIALVFRRLAEASSQTITFNEIIKLSAQGSYEIVSVCRKSRLNSMTFPQDFEHRM